MKIKDKYYHNYQAIYPGVDISVEVMEVLRKSDRKMKYMEYDLKQELFVVDEKNDSVRFLPSREDSLERLIEVDKQFKDETPTAEQCLMSFVEHHELRHCLSLLSEDEQALIQALFFRGVY